LVRTSFRKSKRPTTCSSPMSSAGRPSPSTRTPTAYVGGGSSLSRAGLPGARAGVRPARDLQPELHDLGHADEARRLEAPFGAGALVECGLSPTGHWAKSTG